MKQKHAVLLLFVALFLIGASAQVLAMYPGGVDNFTIISSQQKKASSGTQIVAERGNITWLAITYNQLTKKWQGFVGNITGSITLDDTSNDTLYSWNLSNISGQIFASRNCSIDWTTVQVQNDCDVDTELTGGGSDSVKKTFTPSSNQYEYQIYDLQVSTGQTCAAWPYVNDSKQDGTYLFENVLFTTGTDIIYAGHFETQVEGFDGGTYDFQLLVPVNKSSKFTTYCLYAELD